MKKTVNYTMLLSLIIVAVTGFLLKPMPFTSIRILHVISGMIFVIASVYHMKLNQMFKRSKA